MFQNRDTIAAQATAAGEGGVAIVRVSGADCETVVSRVFRAKNGKPLANRVLTYGCVMENGEIADEAMAVLMRAPHSYTRENVAEIQCHGSQALVRKILMLLMAAGAALSDAVAALSDGMPLDVAAVDLSAALDALGEITGETMSEKVIDEVFAKFCVGK